VPLDQLAQEATGLPLAFMAVVGCTSIIRPSSICRRPKEGEAAIAGGPPAQRSNNSKAAKCARQCALIHPRDMYQLARKASRRKDRSCRLIVFREDALIVNDDGFETKRQRINGAFLRLDENDEYVIEVYRNRVGTAPTNVYYPTDFSGRAA
jgi:hypothetical protein